VTTSATLDFIIPLFRSDAQAPAEESKEVPEPEVPAATLTKIEQLEKAFSGHGSAAANARILQEYKYLVASKECKGLTVEFDQDTNIYQWNAYLDIDHFDVTGQLKTDFDSYAQRHERKKEIVFEIRFDENFPFNPPFLRVVRPRFGFHTGHVTIGGSICMESLTPSGWIPVRTVESVFIEILFNMCEGGARLDSTNAHVDYTLEEAKAAFERVARQHGWLS
jgi:ubiquitin-conjugating enzyme E2 Q